MMISTSGNEKHGWLDVRFLWQKYIKNHQMENVILTPRIVCILTRMKAYR